MLSSKFLVVSFLYILYAAQSAVADPHFALGGRDQFCQSVKTVTVTHTVAPGQPSPSSRPANNGNSPPPAVTTRPGNVNLDNGTTNIKNTKTSSVNTKTKTSGVIKNTQTSSGKKNTKTSSSKISTITSPANNGSVKNGNVNTNTKNVNTKTSSTGLSTTSLPPISATGRSLAVSSSTAAPPANTGTGNPNTSLTLDPSVIQNINGQGQAAGESNSLVSTNNFIGFCVGKTITNGKQVQTGSCNPTPIGDIPSVDKMPSAKFNSPKNFDTIAANTPFTISLQTVNLVTGTFTNADNTYYAAPQQLVGGVIQGHSHVTVQQMTSLDSPQPLSPKIFAFFKGLNAASPNGVLTADVTKGLPAGVYRISSINSAGNHQEVLGPVAQRGSFNDAIYITVADGGDAVSSSAVPPSSSGVSSDVLSSSASLPAVSSISPAVPSSTGKGGKVTKTSSSASLPVSTSTGGEGGNVVSSSELPVSTSTGGKKGGKGGDVMSTSTALPKSTTPAGGNGKPNAQSSAVSSSASLPDSTPTKGAPGQGGNKQNSRRMHKRSERPRLA